MSLLSWIRDLIGIKKDTIEVTIGEEELKRLKNEQRELESIIQADMEDIKKLMRKIFLRTNENNSHN